MAEWIPLPWVAAGSPHGQELALEWMDARDDKTMAAGWATYSSLVSTKNDDDLDLAEVKKLLARVARTIRDQPDRVRYCMNGFVIAVGSYVKSLTQQALQAARKIVKVSVDMGDTACKVPAAEEYIKKVEQRGTIGKKRKSAKC